MSPDLTLICPTYNRRLYLERSAQFWRNRDVNVIYADGSEAACSSPYLDSPNICYLHYPVSLHERLSAMVTLVKSPYVCMMGDDEFYIPSALQACVEYLESHADYVACMGRAISFSRLKDEVALCQQYPRLQNRDLSDNSATDRLEKHFSAYVPAHCYAVTRSEVFRSSMETALSIKHDVFALSELVEEFLVVAAGKSVVLPALHWLRSYEALPLRNTGDLTLDTSKNFDSWWQSLASIEEKSDFCMHLSSASSGIVDEGEVEHVIDCYVNHSYSRASSRIGSLWYSIKRSLPEALKKPLRSLRSLGTHIVNQFTNPAAQSKVALQELRDQGVMIDEDGLAQCLSSIKNSWRVCGP